MHAAGVVITVIRNRNLRNAALFSAAAVFVAVVVVVASILAAMQSVLGQACGSTGPTDNTTFVSSDPSDTAESGIPKDYLAAYQDAGEEYGIDWAILAGVGFVESKHGTYGGGCAEGPQTEYGTAKGPMQFIDPTWETEGVDGNGDGEKDPCDIEDAAHSAASYLKNSGAPGDYQGALFTYNNSQEYVDDVMAKADEYRSSGGSEDNTEQASTPAASAPSGGANLATITLASRTLSFVPMIAQITPGSTTGSGQPPQGWDLVDDDRKIHYQLDTKYGSYFESAAEEWNQLGGVSIEPSPSPGETDLVVTDGSTGGPMAETHSDGKLVYEPTSMRSATDNAREAVSGHELGHALGYRHNNEESVMQTPIITNTDTNITEPTSYDEQLHAQTWGGGQPSDGSQEDSADEPAVVWPTKTQFTDGYEGGEDTAPASEDGANIAAPAGQPVYSMVDGEVVKPADTNENYYSQEGGYSVLVEATEDSGPVQEGDLIYYAHMQGPPSFSEGDQVEAGQEIGKVGSSGGGPEGTTDQREAGLHIGWYDGSGERADSPTHSINPYHLLSDIAESGGEISDSEDNSEEGTYTETSGGGDSGATPALCKAFGLGGSDEGSPTGGGTIRGSGTGKEVVQEAAKYDGVDYVLGGPAVCKPGETMDCTCLTTTVFKEFGYTGSNELPGMPQEVLNYGKSIPPEEAEAGDVYVYEDPGNYTGGHVAIATGDGGVFHCANEELGCTFGPDYKSAGATPVSGAVSLVEDDGGGGSGGGSSDDGGQ